MTTNMRVCVLNKMTVLNEISSSYELHILSAYVLIKHVIVLLLKIKLMRDGLKFLTFTLKTIARTLEMDLTLFQVSKMH